MDKILVPLMHGVDYKGEAPAGPPELWEAEKAALILDAEAIEVRGERFQLVDLDRLGAFLHLAHRLDPVISMMGGLVEVDPHADELRLADAVVSDISGFWRWVQRMMTIVEENKDGNQ